MPLIVVLGIDTGQSQAATKKGKRSKKQPAYVMTEAELQAQVMAFADRYVSIISAASLEYDAQSPSPDNRRIIRGQIVYSIANAFVIAAEPDPDVALLDLVVMVTLGRLIFEEHWKNKFGSEVNPIIAGLKTAEADIWQVAANVLTKQQQKELMAIIWDWRLNHPEVITFSYIRFGDFVVPRRKEDTSKSKKSKGLFGSVEDATQQVEEMRLLAERGMYLGTRMPLMIGAFVDVWLSQFATNPDVDKTLNDLHQISGVSERLATVAEKLPAHIAAERQAAVKQVITEVDALGQATLDRVMNHISSEREATIDHLVDRITTERENAINHLVDRMANQRKQTIEEFLAEEKRMRGLLTDLKQTLAAGNNVLTSTNTLVERLNLGQTDSGSATPSEPFDIKDYQATLAEASGVIVQLDGLVRTVDQWMLSPGWEKALPGIVRALEKAEEQGEKWVQQAFLLGVFLILILLTGAVLAMLAYRYITHRFFETNQKQSVS
jgi:hypothetical protein